MSACRLSVWVGLLIALFEMPAYCASQEHWPHVIVNLPGGRVNLFAAVVDSGCLVSVSNSDRIVEMGKVTSHQFSGVGSDARAVPFFIQLDECSGSVIQSVAVAFNGVMNEQDLQVLAITPGLNAAEGIGLAIFNADNKLLPVNMPPLQYTRLNKGINTLSFFAKYRLTKKVLVPGVADAWAEFTLTYQ